MKKLMSNVALALVLVSSLSLTSCGDAELNPSPELTVVSPPNPNLFPVFLMMKDNPELTIKLITVDSGSGVPAYFQSGEADITTIYTYIMAKHISSGDVPDLQLRAVTLWDNFYLVGNQEITSLSDLLGKTILITGPNGTGKNGPADKLIRAAIIREGYEASDFNIEYDLIDDAMDRVANNQAAAILLAEPAATGFVAKSTFSNGNLTKAVSMQQIFAGYNSWAANQLPLGGVATLASYQTEEKTQAVEDFVVAYKEASNKIMEDKMSSAQTISNGLKSYYGIELPWPIILRSLNEGTLAFDANKPLGSIQPELGSFITELVGPFTSDTFYKE